MQFAVFNLYVTNCFAACLYILLENIDVTR